MGKINMGRVVLGGIVAGIVGNILGYLVDGLMLAPQWSAGMRALGRPDFSTNQIVGFNIVGLAYGILSPCGCTPRFARATAVGRKRLFSQDC